MNEFDIKLLQAENKALTKRINNLKFAINTYRDILKVDKYKQALQEIKDIVTALYMNEWLQQNETARQSIQLLQDIINKAEV